jgi:hypothetical protein
MATKTHPEQLFKFRAFRTPLCKHKCSIAEPGKCDERECQERRWVLELLGGRLKFSSPSAFNDPFEGKPAITPAFSDPTAQRLALVEYVANKVATSRGESLSHWMPLIEREIGSKSNEQVADEWFRAHFTSAFDESRIFCASAPDAIAAPLIWSHYADNHRGVCIGFDASQAPFNFFKQVEYAELYPTISIPMRVNSGDEVFSAGHLRKSHHWSYECEWRLVTRVSTPVPGLSWDGDVGVVSNSVARSITFGACAETHLRDALTAWAKVNMPHLEIWQSTLHARKYEICRERLK